MNDTFDEFDVVLQLLGGNMQHDVVKVIKPFLDLKKIFDSHQVHNISPLMFDPHFKSLLLWKTLCGVEM